MTAIDDSFQAAMQQKRNRRFLEPEGEMCQFLLKRVWEFIKDHIAENMCGNKWGFNPVLPKHAIQLNVEDKATLQEYRDLVSPHKLTSVFLQIIVKSRRVSEGVMEYSGTIERRICYSIGIMACNFQNFEMQIVGQNEDHVFAALRNVIKVFVY